MVSKLEFLCDAIAEYTGSHDPRSDAYRMRNPLALRETRFDRETKKLKVGELREYRSWVCGYESALYDLRMKCSGQSQSGLTEYSSIADLTKFYGLNGSTAENVADFLSVALSAKITRETKLFVFLK
jgi:hypothetical protein